MNRGVPCLITGIHAGNTAALGYLPALLLTGDGESGPVGAHLEHLVRHGWTYAGPPLRLTPVPQSCRAYVKKRPRTMRLTPCPTPDDPPLGRPGPPPRSRAEWSQRIRELGHRCAVVLAPTLDGHAANLAARVSREARHRRVIWAIVQISEMPPTPNETPVLP